MCVHPETVRDVRAADPQASLGRVFQTGQRRGDCPPDDRGQPQLHTVRVDASGSGSECGHSRGASWRRQRERARSVGEAAAGTRGASGRRRWERALSVEPVESTFCSAAGAAVHYHTLSFIKGTPLPVVPSRGPSWLLGLAGLGAAQNGGPPSWGPHEARPRRSWEVRVDHDRVGPAAPCSSFANLDAEAPSRRIRPRPFPLCVQAPVPGGASALR